MEPSLAPVLGCKVEVKLMFQVSLFCCAGFGLAGRRELEGPRI